MTNGVPQTVRSASDADSLISDMRALMQSTEPAIVPLEGDELERVVSRRVTVFLMLLLLGLVFVTSAVPDLGPSLASVVQAHL